MSFLATRLARFSSVSSLNSTDAPARRGLAVGTPAPDFTLRDQFGQDVDAVVVRRARRRCALVFFPWAFSNVCTVAR